MISITATSNVISAPKEVGIYISQPNFLHKFSNRRIGNIVNDNNKNKCYSELTIKTKIDEKPDKLNLQ